MPLCVDDFSHAILCKRYTLSITYFMLLVGELGVCYRLYRFRNLQEFQKDYLTRQNYFLKYPSRIHDNFQ